MDAKSGALDSMEFDGKIRQAKSLHFLQAFHPQLWAELKVLDQAIMKFINKLKTQLLIPNHPLSRLPRRISFFEEGGN